MFSNSNSTNTPFNAWTQINEQRTMKNEWTKEWRRTLTKKWTVATEQTNNEQNEEQTQIVDRARQTCREVIERENFDRKDRDEILIVVVV